MGQTRGWREITIASWAGMRGVVTLAAALALPTPEDGFPEGDRMIFIAFVVIIVPLVLLQGLTLPILVLRLGVQAPVEEGRRVGDRTSEGRPPGGRRRGGSGMPGQASTSAPATE